MDKTTAYRQGEQDGYGWASDKMAELERDGKDPREYNWAQHFGSQPGVLEPDEALINATTREERRALFGELASDRDPLAWTADYNLGWHAGVRIYCEER